MVALACIDAVHDKFRTKILNAISRRCEIGCCIERSAIRLLDQQWTLAIGKANNQCTVVAHRKIRIHNCIDSRSEAITKETLSTIMLGLQVNSQNLRCFIDLSHRDIDQFLPIRHNSRVARLQSSKRVVRITQRGGCSIVLRFQLCDAMRSNMRCTRGGKSCFIITSLHLCISVCSIQIIKRHAIDISLRSSQCSKSHRNWQSPIT